MTNGEVLNSWKEVAAYLGRGVRTVQRWEQELGLPVRRPRGRSRSAVIAFKAELDQWLHHAPAEQLRRERGEELIPAQHQAQPNKFNGHGRLHENTELLIGKMHLLLSRSSNLCEKMQSLRQKVERTVKLTAVHVKGNGTNSNVVIVASTITEPEPARPEAKPAGKQVFAS